MLRHYDLPRDFKAEIRSEFSAIRCEWINLLTSKKNEHCCSAAEKLRWVMIRNNLEDTIRKLVKLPCVKNKQIGILRRDSVEELFQKLSNLWDIECFEVMYSSMPDDFNWDEIRDLFRRLWRSLWDINRDIEIFESSNI